jgi:hypothetical protein
MKLNEIAKTINSREGKRDDNPWERLLMARLMGMGMRGTRHPGSKPGAPQYVRHSGGNTAKAITRTKRSAPGGKLGRAPGKAPGPANWRIHRRRQMEKREAAGD